MRRLSRVVFTVFLILAFITCEEHGGGGSVSEVIGSEGGTITSRDGRLTLIFPPGALSEDTKITIKEIEPGELPAEFEGLSVTHAYQLEPEGIVFDLPVTAVFVTDETPLKDDGSIATQGVLLISETDGEFEVLENLVIEIDGDENTTTASADLNHFSKLKALDRNVQVIINDVPDMICVGQTFHADVVVFEIDIGPDITSPPLYEDTSQTPIVRNFDPAKQSMPVFTDKEDPFITGGKAMFPYKCTEPGLGLYSCKINVKVNARDQTQANFNLFKFVECCPPGTPIPTPSPDPSPGPSPAPSPEPSPGPEPTPQPTEPPIEVCAQLGDYASMVAGCGIGMFTLANVSGEGNLVVSGFGANPGNTTFNKTNVPTIFESVNTNLIIFGEEGHTCFLKCAAEANQLLLECARPGAMCTEVFTLQ